MHEEKDIRLAWNYIKKKAKIMGKKKYVSLRVKLLAYGPCPSLNGKAIAELRPIRSQSPLAHSRTLLLYGQRFKHCTEGGDQNHPHEIELKITEKRREAKGKGEKERYAHLNAEFQRIVRRDKKAFLSEQCKEIEESNRGKQ